MTHLKGIDPSGSRGAVYEGRSLTRLCCRSIPGEVRVHLGCVHVDRPSETSSNGRKARRSSIPQKIFTFKCNLGSSPEMQSKLSYSYPKYILLLLFYQKYFSLSILSVMRFCPKFSLVS